MSYSNGSHTVFHNRYHIMWVTKYRCKVLEGPLRERIRMIGRADRLRSCRASISICLSRYRRTLRSATSCAGSKAGPRIAFTWSSPNFVGGTGDATSGLGLLLHHKAQHYGRYLISVYSV